MQPQPRVLDNPLIFVASDGAGRQVSRYVNESDVGRGRRDVVGGISRGRRRPSLMQYGRSALRHGYPTPMNRTSTKQFHTLMSSLFLM